MAPHLESSFSIRNLLANTDDNNTAITPPPSDGSLSPNNSISSNEEEDPHYNRPNYTFNALVAMAIRSSPEGKMTLNAIQNWISDNFPYYRKDEQGWQNQIRQTLSTNSCFLKVKRALGDPGRGNYWTISPELPANGTVFVSNGTAVGPLVSGLPHPNLPNAVYFPTPQEIRKNQQAIREQKMWFAQYQQQAYLLQLQQQQLQQQLLHQRYSEEYQKLVCQQQQFGYFFGSSSPYSL